MKQVRGYIRVDNSQRITIWYLGPINDSFSCDGIEYKTLEEAFVAANTSEEKCLVLPKHSLSSGGPLYFAYFA